jgi:predicted MFS family arabinose efflux permease
MASNLVGWKLLFLLCLTNCVAFVAVFAVPPIIGDLVHEFQITYTQAGIFMTVYAVVRTLGSLLAGTYSDRYGIKYFVLTGIVLVSLAGFLSSTSSNFSSMVTWRTLIAIGATSVFIPGLTASMLLLPPEHLNLAVGAFISSLQLGLTVAFFSTPILASSFGWRIPLKAFAAASAVVSVLFFLLTRHQSIRQAPSNSIQDGGRARGAYSIRNLSLALVSASYFLMLFQVYGMITWLPEYLKTARGYSPAQVGSVSMLLGLILIPGSVSAGWLGDRMSAWAVAVVGAMLSGICPAVLILFPHLTLAGVFTDVFFLAFGTSMLAVPLTSIVTHVVPQKDRGKAIGLVYSVGYSGSMVSTYLGGYLVTISRSYTWSFSLFAMSMLVVLLFLGMLKTTYDDARLAPRLYRTHST